MFRTTFVSLLCLVALHGCSTPSPSVKADIAGDSAGIDVGSIHNATPRFEPIHQASTKPYTANNLSFTPMSTHQPYNIEGTMSWYGKPYHGRKTSNGEIYDMYAMTAAHPTLPIPSYVRVTNKDNSQSVILRVNDRGPFVNDRIIDVSFVAALKLGFAEKGIAPAKVELIMPSDYPKDMNTMPSTSASANTTSMPSSAKVVTMPSTAFTDSTLASGYFVQMGAFLAVEGAQALKRKMAFHFPNKTLIQKRDEYHRVLIGPYKTKAEADRVKKAIAFDHHINGFVVENQ